MRRYLAICALVLLCASPAYAVPVLVDYTVEGQSGDWTLDFSLRNNIPPGGAVNDFTLYRFGVSVPEATITGSPLAWTPDPSITVNSLTYEDAWRFDSAPWYTPHHPAEPPIILFSSTTVPGFLMHSDAEEAPLSASWVSFGSAMPGNGIPGQHSGGMYPGSKTRIAVFTGSSTGVLIDTPQAPPGAAVPEAGTWMLTGLGLLAMGWLSRHYSFTVGSVQPLLE